VPAGKGSPLSERPSRLGLALEGRRAFVRGPLELHGAGYASSAVIASSGTALDSVTIPAAARSRGAIEAT